MRKTHCYVCGIEVDEGIRFNSLQHFDHVVCSMDCGIKSIAKDNLENI